MAKAARAESRWPYWLERNRRSLDGATGKLAKQGGYMIAYHAKMEAGDPEKLEALRGEDEGELVGDVSDWIARLVDEWGLPLRVRVFLYNEASDAYREETQVRVTRGPKRRDEDDDEEDDDDETSGLERLLTTEEGQQQLGVLVTGLGALVAPLMKQWADASAASQAVLMDRLLERRLQGGSLEGDAERGRVAELVERVPVGARGAI